MDTDTGKAFERLAEFKTGGLRETYTIPDTKSTSLIAMNGCLRCRVNPPLWAHAHCSECYAILRACRDILNLLTETHGIVGSGASSCMIASEAKAIADVYWNSHISHLPDPLAKKKSKRN